MPNWDDGGPAFPEDGVVEWFQCEGSDPVPHRYGTVGGMTLRDYFAARSMQSLLTLHIDDQDPAPGAIARRAYLIADAMIAQRER